ncbi:MAG: hypothetical protein ACI4TV_06935 [Paludibacteraceae bacterium]
MPEQDLILEKGHLLYRYDIKQPPTNWSKEFKSYEYPGIGPKNKVGAFFFYDSEKIAIQTFNNEERQKAEMYITTTNVTKELKLLNLRIQHILGIFNLLREIGIDVFTDDFHTYYYVDGRERSLLDIKQQYEQYVNLFNMRNLSDEQYAQIGNFVERIANFIVPNVRWDHTYSFIGQLLTDLDNGPKFKELLTARGYDGYVFYEHNEGLTPLVHAYCIFEPTNLGAPACAIYKNE